MKLNCQMPPDRECLHADLVGRQNRRVRWRLAPIAVELQPRPRRDHGFIGRVDHRPADFLSSRRPDPAAERHAQRLSPEANPTLPLPRPVPITGSPAARKEIGWTMIDSAD